MPCLDCGQPGHRRRCPRCTRGVDRARGTTAARGYGAEHRRLRAEWQQRIDDGEEITCTRCGQPIGRDGAWALDHDDDNRSRYRGPSHADCNNAAGGRQAHRDQR